MKDLLKSFAEKYNFQISTLPIERLKDLEKDFQKSLEKGLIADKVNNNYLQGFSFRVPDDHKNAKSIIVIGIARPQHRLKIELDGGDIDTIIPPTYLDYRKIFRDILKSLKDWFTPHGFGISRASIPLKLTAARSGLVKYGKNNITYIEKWGSFHQLLAFFTDWDPGADPWQEIEILKACRICTLCMEACINGAILEDRFNIDMKRCLTLMNESKDDIPAWVRPEAHNSLIGCMSCQLVCPYNIKVKEWIVDIGRLRGEEIRLIEDSRIFKEKGSKLVGRLRDMGLYEWLEDVPLIRNLRLLTDR